MSRRRLLYLDAHGVSAWRWRAGHLAVDGEFPADSEGIHQFASYVSAHPATDFHVLADLAEEAYHTDTLPYVRGADRDALIQRKLTQHFFGSPLSAAIAQGRETTGRRDERVLFGAITVPQVLEPWLAALRSHEAQLAGIWTPALVAAPLYARLAKEQPYAVFVTLQRAGLRQTFFDHGEVRFSRLTPVAQASPNAVALACSVESMRIRQYVSAQLMMPDGLPLPTYLLVHRSQAQAYASTCRSNADVTYEILDLVEVGTRFGLRERPADSRAETLFLHLLAQRPSREQLAPAPERRFHTLARSRAMLLGGGAVVLGACLLLAAKEAYTIAQLRSEAAATRLQTAAESERYNAVTRRFPALRLPTETLRAATAAYGQLERRSALPDPLYLRISEAMERAPRVDLERIDWLTSANPNESGLSATPTPAAQAAATAPRPGEGDMFQIAIVHARLPAAMLNDQRGMLDAVEGFADVLRNHPDLRVSVLSRPFETDPGQSLRGTAEPVVTTEPPRFSVRVSRKL